MGVRILPSPLDFQWVSLRATFDASRIRYKQKMEKTTAEPGDYVQVHLMQEIYEGTFLEAPESEKGIILLKLDTGYNIGFNRKEVLKVKVLRKFKRQEEKLD